MNVKIMQREKDIHLMVNINKKRNFNGGCVPSYNLPVGCSKNTKNGNTKSIL